MISSRNASSAPDLAKRVAMARHLLARLAMNPCKKNNKSKRQGVTIWPSKGGHGHELVGQTCHETLQFVKEKQGKVMRAKNSESKARIVNGDDKRTHAD